MSQRLLPPITFALCVALYLLTLTSVHTYDALSYILDVDRKPWPELFHPHHLAYGPLGALIGWAATALGWQGSAERLLQVTNALAGALGVSLLGALVARVVGRSGLAAPPMAGRRTLAGAAAALLLASSYAYWYYAVEVEVYTIAALFLIVCLGLMLATVRAPSHGLAAALGAAQGCAVLFHQTNVLLCAPAVAALLLAGTGREVGGARSGGSAGLLAAYGLPLALIVGGAYLWVGLGVSGFRSWGDLGGGVAGYATTGFWGGAVDSPKLARLGQGLAETFAQPGGALVGLALIAALLARVGALRGTPRGTVPVCLSWLLAYGAFFLWWEPDNIEFWIASLPPFYLLVALAAFAPRPGPRSGVLVEYVGPLVVIACGLAMLGINYRSITARGDAERDLQRELAAALAARSQPGELLVVPDGMLELYLPFYEGREHVLALGQAMTATGGDWPAACALMRARVEEAMAGGYGVLVAAEALRPAPAPPGEPPTPAERFGLTPDDVGACYEPLRPALEPVPDDAMQGTLRIPGAQDLADGPGWDFTRSRWGWRAANAEATTSVLPGWALRPGEDPALTSPPVRIDTGRYGWVEVRIAIATAARDAQLYLLDEAGQVDEARSARWALEPGPTAHTYRIDLRSTPGWDGVVTGLRLDPVGVGDGGTVVLESIRLLP